MDTDNYKQAVTKMYLAMGPLFEATEIFRVAAHTVWNWDKPEDLPSAILEETNTTPCECSAMVESLQRIINQQKQRIEFLEGQQAHETRPALGEPRSKRPTEPIICIHNIEPFTKEELKDLLKSFNSPHSIMCNFVENADDPLHSETLFGAMTEADYQAMIKAVAPPLPSSPSSQFTVENVNESGPPVMEIIRSVVEIPPDVVLQPKPPRPDYNNKNWPSPRTKRFAKQIAETMAGSGSTQNKTIKTHQDALNYLAAHAKISLEALMQMNEYDYQVAYATWMCPTNNTTFYTGQRSRSWWR